MFERDELLKVSIKDYLENIGIPTRKEGRRYFCSSPFTSDRNWSFCIYPTNTYFDFSAGHGGNLINLVSRLHNVSFTDAAKILKEEMKYEKFERVEKRKEPEQQGSSAPFDYKKYLNTDPEECAQIKAYASSRGITEGYECGVFFTMGNRGELEEFTSRSKSRNTKSGGSNEIEQSSSSHWIRNPALMFIHVDKQLQPCGVKFRRIDKKEPRFSARGNLGFYVLENNRSLEQKKTNLYIVESETSANSLWAFLKKLGVSSVVVSRGGVSFSTTLNDLPEHLQNLPKKLIIDYDGNEKLYQERLKLYEGLGAEPIKLILPKDQDINSLYVKGEMNKIAHLL